MIKSNKIFILEVLKYVFLILVMIYLIKTS